MYAGSVKGTYNGTDVTLPLAPIRIKYTDSGKTTCLVPSRFVAETFGMDYTWTQSNSTVTIYTPIELIVDGESYMYAGTFGNIRFDNENIPNSKAPSYIFNDNAIISVKVIADAIDGLRYDYSKKSGKISLYYGEYEINMTVGSTDCYVNGLYTVCPVAPHNILNPDIGKAKLYVPARFIFETMGFGYTWSSATSIITTNESTGIFKPSYDFALVYDPSDEEVEDSDIPDTAEDTENEDPEDSESHDQADVEVTVPSSKRSEYYQVLKIPVLDGVRTDLITITDRLWENLVTFDLPGNYIEYYTENPIINTGEAVIQVQILYYEDKDVTRFNIYTRSAENNIILSHKDLFTSKNMVFIFDKPSCLYDKIIVLDAGHGGEDPGTKHGGYNEKDLNFMIVYTYCKALFDKSDIKVFYSRYDDYLVPLHDRPTLPARVEADFFISVHHNSVYSTLKNGTEVYYSVENTGNYNGMRSAEMASMFLSNLVDALKTNKNGTVGARNYVVVSEENTVPAVLLEIGYMSNPTELKKLVKASTQKKVAKVIYNTVKQIYKKYGY